ncbi:hypothetical protein WV31_16795 [Magnetospirillum sp. ME-1]|uniref:glycosyltransferase family 10 domain-containing protein n=1 Tax=Magnetospirillum sp. ME-1 TaxID=1639348 RepID=UPI000A17D58D|nr:glycosyltransferase family 10 [Magnetospirillum sp. ME-1]ARJ67206.1 hypothetical protein WV31_16795 [Magnetospirillum sp. ME-1]
MDAAQAFNEAVTALHEGRFLDSQKLCLEILNQDPRHFGSLIIMATLHQQVGNFQEAINLLTHAGSFQLFNDWQFVLFARALAAVGRKGEAVDQYLKALVANPDIRATTPDLYALLEEKRREPDLPHHPFPSPPWKASLVADRAFMENRIFTPMPDTYLSHWPISNWVALRAAMATCGIDLATYDINPPETSDLIFYVNVNSMRHLPEGEEISRSVLLAYEPAVVIARNRDTAVHEHFAKVFIADDSLVDNVKIFKMPMAYCEVPATRPQFDARSKTKLCTMVNSAKYWPYFNELYSQRMALIRWFEEHHPEDFEFYGAGWKAAEYPSYRGAISNREKVSIQAPYRFAVCYENNSDSPGAITEKIFDCLLGGCVPIYWGVPNITAYVPKTCFIDRRDFATNEELYNYLKGMGDDELQGYLDSISDYLVGDRCRYFTDQCFASTILRQVLGMLP